VGGVTLVIGFVLAIGPGRPKMQRLFQHYDPPVVAQCRASPPANEERRWDSNQLEREAEEVRWRLQATLEELRARVTPGAVIDQVIEYARRGPVGEFFRNLGREAQENPLPLVLIGIGIAWLAVSASRSSSVLIAGAADAVSRKAAEASAATGAVLGRTSDTAARMAAGFGDVSETVGKRTADLAARIRYAADGLAERAEEATAMTAVVLGREEWALAGAAAGRRVRLQGGEDDCQ
jgi:hypothetical protein